MNAFVVSIPNHRKKEVCKKSSIWRFNLSNDDLIFLRPGLKTGVKMPFFGLKNWDMIWRTEQHTPRHQEFLGVPPPAPTPGERLIILAIIPVPSNSVQNFTFSEWLNFGSNPYHSVTTKIVRSQLLLKTKSYQFFFSQTDRPFINLRTVFREFR